MKYIEMMDKIDALVLVETLNEQTFIYGGCIGEIDLFNFESTYYFWEITFLNISLISSENDEREWINSDTKEPLRDFVIREAKKVLSDLTVRMQQI